MARDSYAVLPIATSVGGAAAAATAAEEGGECRHGLGFCVSCASEGIGAYGLPTRETTRWLRPAEVQLSRDRRCMKRAKETFRKAGGPSVDRGCCGVTIAATPRCSSTCGRACATWPSGWCCRPPCHDDIVVMVMAW